MDFLINHFLHVKLMENVFSPLTECLVCVVLQACLCRRCVPLQAVPHDEAQSVLKSRIQDQASEESNNIKAHKQTSTLLPEPENPLLC